MEKLKIEVNQDRIIKQLVERQNGNIESAERELRQNSLDAGATKISIRLNSHSLRHVDNGAGMSEDKIKQYLRILGNTSKLNQKTLGEFGIGVSQILPFGKVVFLSRDNAAYIDFKNLGTDFLFTKRDQYIDGTIVICSFYETLYSFQINEHLEGIKDQFITDGAETFINGERIESETRTLEEYSDSKIEVFESPRFESQIFVGNLRIKSFNSNFTYNINVHLDKLDKDDELKLNFARNQFIETGFYHTIRNRINKVEARLNGDKHKFNRTEGKKLLTQIRDGDQKLEDYYDKRFIPGNNDRLYSPKELKDGEVYIGKDGKVSDTAQEIGYKSVPMDIGELIKSTTVNKNLKVSFGGDVKKVSPKCFYRTISSEQLNETAKEIFDICWRINEVIFNEERSLRVGESDMSDAWTDGIKIHLSKSLLERYNSKFLALVNIGKTLIHEYSHYDSIQEPGHGWDFNRRFRENMDKYYSSLMNFIDVYI